MTSRKKPVTGPRLLPIPYYGRGAFFGLAGALFGAAFWAFYMAVTDSYQLLMPAGAGWFASACVKRGMVRADATGIALSLYFTAMIVFLGEYFYYAWVCFTNTGTVSLGLPFSRLVGFYRAYPKDFFYLLLFTGLGFAVAVLNCRESDKKRRPKKPAAPETVDEDSKGENTA